MYRKVSKVIMLMATVGVLTSCAVNAPYHVDYLRPNASAEDVSAVGGEKQSEFWVNCSTSQAELKRPFHLSFIEVDNQGDFFNMAELHRTIQTLNGSQGRILLITYIHGWQNNASVEGLGPEATNAEVQVALNKFNTDANKEVGDVQRFKHFLAILANTPSLHDLSVYGVYLGWRGELIENPSNDPITKYVVMTIPRALTFWSRQSTATRMGEGSAFGEVLEAIHQFASDNQQRVINVVMGHSFGAKILEQAVVQWAMRQFGDQIATQTDFANQHFEKRYADLVLFMNPASESIYARRLVHILKNYGDDYYRPPPLFIGVTSNTDVATGLAFPIATTLGTLGGSYRSFNDGTDQSRFFRTTSVNNEFLHNGEIDVSSHYLWDRNGKKSASSEEIDRRKQLSEVESLSDTINNLDYNLSHRKLNGNNEDTEAYDVFLANGLLGAAIFQRYTDSDQPANRTRYWLLNVDSHIIDGHSGVWSNNAMNLYARLFCLAAQDRLAQISNSYRIKDKPANVPTGG